MTEQEKVISTPTETEWIEAKQVKGKDQWDYQEELRKLREQNKWLGLILRPRDRRKYTMRRAEDELDINDFSIIPYWAIQQFDFVVFIGKKGHLLLKNRLLTEMEVPGLTEILS